MDSYIKLFFVGFSIGLLPALSFLLLVGAFRAVTECAELAAD